MMVGVCGSLSRRREHECRLRWVILLKSEYLEDGEMRGSLWL